MLKSKAQPPAYSLRTRTRPPSRSQKATTQETRTRRQGLAGGDFKQRGDASNMRPSKPSNTPTTAQCVQTLKNERRHNEATLPALPGTAPKLALGRDPAADQASTRIGDTPLSANRASKPSPTLQRGQAPTNKGGARAHRG